MSKQVLIFGIFLLLVHQACDVNDKGTENVTEIEGKIQFKISESYNSEEPVFPSLTLSLETTDSFACSNYQIVSDLTTSKSEITVVVSGVSISPFCLTAIGPANKRHFLDIENGNYKLKLSYKKQTEEYDVSITNDAIEIHKITHQSGLNESNFISLHDVYYRYPENSFAFIGGTHTSNTEIYENLLDSLKTKFQITEFSFPNEGVKPYQTSAQGHYVDYPSVYFKYQNEYEYQRVGEYINYYSGKYIYSDTGITIYTINWKNEKFMSWLYDIE